MTTPHPHEDAADSAAQDAAGAERQETAPGAPENQDDTEVLLAGSTDTKRLPAGSTDTEILPVGTTDTEEAPGGSAGSTEETAVLHSTVPDPATGDATHVSASSQQQTTAFPTAPPAPGSWSAGDAPSLGVPSRPAPGGPTHDVPTATAPSTAGPSAPHPSATMPSPTAAAVAAPPTKQRGPRMGTVVWGMLLAAFGAAIVARGLGVTFDVELALIALLCLMGGALLLGSIVAVVRRG